MDANTLSWILWIPFAIVLVVTSLRFFLMGIRRGLWLSLAHLGITLAVAAIAIPISRLLAPSLWGLLEPLLTKHLSGELSQMLTQRSDVALGIFGSLSALIVYPFVFFLLSVVVRIVSGIFLRPLLTNKKGYSRALGAGVGLVHALVYPVILLLPLYGTLGAFAPAAQAILQTQDNRNPETVMMVETVAQHPTVRLAGTAPIQWFYGKLSTLDIGDSSLNVADAATSVSHMLELAQQLETAPASQRDALLLEMNDYAKNHILEAPWFYTLVVEVGLDRLDGLTDDPTLQQWLASLEGISREDFRKTALAAADLFSVLLAENRLEQAASVKDLLQDEQVVLQLEESLNATPQTQKFKELLLIQTFQETMFGGDQQAATLFVTEVQKDPDTQALFHMQTISQLLQQENSAQIAQYLLEHEDIDVDALAMILAENDLIGKIDPHSVYAALAE